MMMMVMETWRIVMKIRTRSVTTTMRIVEGLVMIMNIRMTDRKWMS
jgi:hypothetical protein